MRRVLIFIYCRGGGALCPKCGICGAYWVTARKINAPWRDLPNIIIRKKNLRMLKITSMIEMERQMAENTDINRNACRESLLPTEYWITESQWHKLRPTPCMIYLLKNKNIVCLETITNLTKSGEKNSFYGLQGNRTSDQISYLFAVVRIRSSMDRIRILASKKTGSGSCSGSDLHLSKT